MIRPKYWDRGEKSPVVVSVGQEPILMSFAGPSMDTRREGVSGFEVAGY